MSQQNDSGWITVTLGGAVTQFDRVKLASGVATVAGLTELGVGIVQQSGVSGDKVRVKTWSAPGTFKMRAAGAVANNATVNTAAAGKCDDAATSTALRLGQALEAAAADTDIFEVLALPALGTTAV